MSWWNPKSWFQSNDQDDDIYVLEDDNDDNSHLNRKPTVSNEGQTLSDIVRGITHAAAASNEIQDQQFLKQVKHYFHVNDDGILEPKVVKVKIDENNYLETPLISIIDPSTLGLKEMEVRMGVKLSKSVIKKRIHDVNKDVDVSRSSFNVSLTGVEPGKRQDVMDVTMKFVKVDPSEGASRLIEEVNGLIQPKSKENSVKKNIFENNELDNNGSSTSSESSESSDSQ